MKRFVLAALAALVCGCDGSSESDSADENDNESCSIDTTLSGGTTGSFDKSNIACIYTSGSIGFALMNDKGEDSLSLSIRIQGLGMGQTGSFPAKIDVNAGSVRWSNADCTLQIDSNEKVEALEGADADRYLLKGSGSCSTAATASDGSKPPVTIAPFKFQSHILDY